MSEKWRQEVIRDKIMKRPTDIKVRLWQHGFSLSLLLWLGIYALCVTAPFVWVSIANSLPWGEIIDRFISKFILSLAVCVFFTSLFISLMPIQRARKLFGIGLITLILIIIQYACLQNSIAINILPIGILAGMTAFSCGANVGMLSVVTFSLLSIILDMRQMDAIISFFISGCFFAWFAPLQRFRMGLLRIAMLSMLVALITGLCWAVGEGQEVIYLKNFHITGIDNLLDTENPLVRELWSAASWLISIAVIFPLLRYQYALFGNTSNIVLQDLQEKPLLGKLLTIAPSSFYHSTVTSALASAGAQAIGANVVLCRIGSLYHDIGKIIKPEYFTENESGISRHDALSPYMSNLIIISHVKDGAEVARHYKLPPEILDMIAQHHGNSQVSFFLRQARDEADGAYVDEALFRYPGPRPQTPEAAIIMIADSVEAASRSLAGNSAAQIRALVNKIVLAKLHDHQFDNSYLTFTDLARIEDAIVRILVSMFHTRISYDKAAKKR